VQSPVQLAVDLPVQSPVRCPGQCPAALSVQEERSSPGRKQGAGRTGAPFSARARELSSEREPPARPRALESLRVESREAKSRTVWPVPSFSWAGSWAGENYPLRISPARRASPAPPHQTDLHHERFLPKYGSDKGAGAPGGLWVLPSVKCGCDRNLPESRTSPFSCRGTGPEKR
jgi:hypothetical protein